MIFVLFLFHSCAKTFDGGYNNVTLKIDSIVPANGTAGTPVRIYGTGFALYTTNNKIFFNGTEAMIDSSNANAVGVLLAYAPANGKTGNVSVANGTDSATGPLFTYVVLPVITTINFAQNTNYNFIISGNNFDPANSIVKFDGQVINGFTYSAGPPQKLSLPLTLLPSNLGNPVQVTVTVNNNASNAYPFLFVPNITSTAPDTVHAAYAVTLQGKFFGNTQGTSTLKTFYLDQSGNKVYMTPSPTIVSWNTNTIQLTTPEYQSYVAVLQRVYFNIFLEVNVGGNTGNIELFYMGH